MSLSFTFRKVASTDALKNWVEKKVDRFTKYVTYSMDVHVTMSIEKSMHVTEIVCHAEHRDLVAVAKTDDLYESIDLAATKILNQLKKEREKRKGHKTAHLAIRKTSLKQGSDVGADLPHREKRSAAKR